MTAMTAMTAAPAVTPAGPYTEAVIGVDLGTTDTKALVCTPGGEAIGFARRPTTWSRSAGGRAETTGPALFADVLAAVAEALAATRAGLGGRPVRVLGLGLAGLGESGVVLDPAGRASSPVIAWYDDRGTAEMAALDPELLAAFPARTGLPVGSQWTLAKLLWLRGVTGRPPGLGSRWLNVPEYVAYALCGEQVGEPSLVSRTALLDQATGSPWTEALDALGAGADFLPQLVPAGQAAGRIGSCAVPELAGAVVTVAGHDHPVAAVGAGAVGADDLFDSCGTAEVLLRSVPGVLSDTDRVRLVEAGVDAGRHALPGHSVLIGGMRSGLLMRRVLSLVGADGTAARDGLDARWRPPAGSTSPVRLVGSSADDDAVTLRLSDGATPDAAWAAALSRVGEQTTALLGAMNAVVGTHGTAVAAGGWTRMRSVREAKSATIPRLAFCAESQPGARGAALFAAVAADGTRTVAEVARYFAAQRAETFRQMPGPPAPAPRTPFPGAVPAPVATAALPPLPQVSPTPGPWHPLTPHPTSKEPSSS
ncbi:FGGY family carbohydrate kinase [Streptomyces sp. NPDC047000]|uniref:FGGY family carbohydrate kinase n=1 Tax=Streptomyces sp. NPDC047000 TaxID=3155474 RepID=UPI003406DBD3